MKGLEPPDRKVIGEDIKDATFSWPIGMPLVGSLGRELWDVRSSLHGFIKKTQKTPQRNLDLALKRKKGKTS